MLHHLELRPDGDLVLKEDYCTLKAGRSVIGKRFGRPAHYRRLEEVVWFNRKQYDYDSVCYLLRTGQWPDER